MRLLRSRNSEDVAPSVTPSYRYRGFIDPNTLNRVVDEIHMTKRFPSRKLELPVAYLMKHDESIGLAVEEYGSGQLSIDNPEEYVSAFVSQTGLGIRFNPRISQRPQITEGLAIVEFNTLGHLTTAAGQILTSHVFTVSTDNELQHPNPLMYPLASGPVS